MAVRKKFGEILVDAGLLTEPSLQKALARQKQTGRHLGQVLEELGLVNEEDVAKVLAKQFNIQIVRKIAHHDFADELLGLLDQETALQKLIFPLRLVDKKLSLAMVNPLDMELINDLSFKRGVTIVPCVTTRSEILAAIRRHYLRKNDVEVEVSDWWMVLVVDDQELVRAAITAALKREGYTVYQAENGAEGLKLALQLNPHLIVTDTVMPRMTGDEMYRLLQGNPRSRNIPVIALSSRSSAEEEARILQLGYHDFVAKPINPVRLQARVKRALLQVYGETPPPRTPHGR